MYFAHKFRCSLDEAVRQRLQDFRAAAQSISTSPKAEALAQLRRGAWCAIREVIHTECLGVGLPQKLGPGVLIGTIRFVSGTRGFGFIRGDMGLDSVWFHITNLQDYCLFQNGIRVRFALARSKKGGKLAAQDVKALPKHFLNPPMLGNKHASVAIVEDAVPCQYLDPNLLPNDDEESEESVVAQCDCNEKAIVGEDSVNSSMQQNYGAAKDGDRSQDEKEEEQEGEDEDDDESHEESSDDDCAADFVPIKTTHSRGRGWRGRGRLPTNPWQFRACASGFHK